MEKIIKLTPLAQIGKGYAKITDGTVEIEVSGVVGAMKVWLIGGEAESIGNLVEGKLHRQVNTKAHSGVLITQSGRQMFLGKYKEDGAQSPDFEKPPFDSGNLKWEKITGRSYAKLCEEQKYILSRRTIFDNYKKYGYYWAGENEKLSALAFKCSENENPLYEFTGAVRKNGYIILCVDKETKRLEVI